MAFYAQKIDGSISSLEQVPNATGPSKTVPTPTTGKPYNKRTWMMKLILMTIFEQGADIPTQASLVQNWLKSKLGFWHFVIIVIGINSCTWRGVFGLKIKVTNCIRQPTR